MGVLYFLFMMFGVFTVRVPRDGWKPDNWTAPARPQAMITNESVDVNSAFKTPQFWLLWIVLCLNVTAGIGIIEQASPMIQDLFKGAIGPVAAGGFVGLLSLFNMGGRFFWSSISDLIGRKLTYSIFFVLGAALYFILPQTGGNHWNSVVLFVAFACVLLSMYGGGFATVPAYLRDMFGTYHVSAIHGRLLTAWSTAGILGPVLVNYTREYQLQHGADKAGAYQSVMHIMAGLLLAGFVANWLVRPVAEKHWLTASVPQASYTTRRLRSEKGLRKMMEETAEILGNPDIGGVDLRQSARGMGRLQHGLEFDEAVSVIAARRSSAGETPILHGRACHRNQEITE